MRLLFIRHAIAMDRAEFEGDDLLRPLTPKGKKRAKKAFQGLRRLYPEIDLIYSSRAVRAKQTAEILARVYGDARIVETERLNPGAEFEHFKQIMSELRGRPETLALVGHEPDFSEIIGSIAGHGLEEEGKLEQFNVEIKKGSCAEVVMVGPDAGILAALLPPRVLRKIAGADRSAKKNKK